MNQLVFLDKEKGIIYRDAGISRALSNTEDGWSERALSFLREYLQSHDRFLCEEVRVASQGIVPDVNPRAWGGIVRRARDLGWIRAIGFRLVENPLAHRTPATEWKRCER